jgi:GTP-dependent phosphoenolpyruvate carboxykinase
MNANRSFIVIKKDWKAKYGLPVNNQNRGVYHIQTSRELSRIIHEHTLSTEPYIVPPTWNKTRHQEEIRQVWQRASEEWSNAKQLFIIGFSVGKTDQFFQHLFALSLTRSQNLRKIFVINNDMEAFNRVRLS